MKMYPLQILAILLTINVIEVISIVNEDHEYWKRLSLDDIKSALDERRKIDGIAKNVIIFIGDGMGPTTITSSRIYGKGVSDYLSFERFPFMGVLKTYSTDQFVPDSCATATALFCGVKTNVKTCGVDSTVKMNDCEASLNLKARHSSVLRWAQDADKSTGFVTTTRVTHATPAALYSHSASRKWECEATMPNNATKCRDIAKQLIEDLPGRNIQVIMGGGRQCLKSHSVNLTEDPIDTWACYSTDGRDLFKTWRDDKLKRNVNHTIVNNNEELNNLDVNNTDFLLGIFANGHMKMNHARDRGPKGMPSLTNMTETALKILRKNKKNGYLLVVEGGLIDFAHHRGHARKALDETVEFSNAISRALELTANETNETLIIVTSDHSHALKLSGYAKRDASVLDIATKSKVEENYFTSLLYSTGGVNNYQYYVDVNNTIKRRNPQLDNTRDFEYSQQAAVLTHEALHDGTDVNVYAKGPMAHLFHRVHEQTYVAYVVGYAAKIGPFNPKKVRNNSTTNLINYYNYLVMLAIVFMTRKRFV